MNRYTNTLPIGAVLKGKTYRYEILEVLGQGSFGIVYKAKMYFLTQNESGVLAEQSDTVAIKEFFMKQFNGRDGSSVTDLSDHDIFEYYKSEFEHEAENLRYMVHPHIVQVFELFQANETVYYSMELLNNRSLDDLIREKGKLPLQEALIYLQDIGSALSCMHDYKMLHLDLKPANIMINREGEALLIDFGLSKRYSQEGKAFSNTQIGKGTPGYSPLEQWNQTETTDFTALMDVYALGATMFKMLTGARPPEAISVASDGFPAYTLQEAGIDEYIMPAIAKAMNPDKTQRFQTVDEFVNACLPEPDYAKADMLEDMAVDASGQEWINLLKEAHHADPTRLSVIKALSDYYMDRKTSDKDLSQSAEWCLKAAKLGDSDSQRDIADMYSYGDGVPENHYLAVKWYREAAKNGNKYAPTFLAEKYIEGKGVPLDYVEAYRWFSLAARINGKDDTVALFSLGYMNENGYGVEVNLEKAISFYKQVADSHEKPGMSKTLDSHFKIPDCMFKLGYIYEHGKGVNVDYNLAEHYYKKAIQYDHASAIFNYGGMIYSGFGCEPNEIKAFELWLKAATQPIYEDEEIMSGQLLAMFNLGVCYEMGYGCQIDYEESLMWYNKAMEYGHDKAEAAIESLQEKIEETNRKSGIFSRIKQWFS